MAKTGQKSTFAGNDYWAHGEKITPVYSGSSSSGHEVKTGTNNNSGGGGKKSSGSKKSSTPKKSAVAKAPEVAKADTKAAASYSGGGGGGGGEASEESSYDAKAAYEAYLKKLRKLAKKVYNQNIEAINNTYAGAGDTLRTNYDSTTGQLRDQYNYQNKNINTDAENSLREAYINSMLQKKDLRQRMAAQGLNGGMTETTMSSLSNNYSNARNNIDTTRNKSLADLSQTYNNNVAEAQRQYNSAVQNLAMQKANAEQDARNAYLQLATQYMFNPGNLSVPSTDYSAALKSQKNFTFNPTEATNNVAGVDSVQGASNVEEDARTNYARYLAQQRAAGASVDSIKNNAYSALQSGQISGDDLISILNQLGIAV